MSLYGEVVEGADVRYHLRDRAGEIVERSAKIVRVWSREDGVVNLVVFVDGSNDVMRLDGQAPVIWETARKYNTACKEGTWHFPPA